MIVFDDTVDLPRAAAADRGLLPRRVVRPVRALPRRHGAAGGGARTARQRAARAARSRTSSRCSREIGQCMRDASICGLGQTASSAIESAIVRLGVFNGGARREPDAAPAPPRRMVELEIDGAARACLRRVRRSSTPVASSASTRRRSATATTLKPVNAVPGLRRRARGRARARAGLLAQGRGRA